MNSPEAFSVNWPEVLALLAWALVSITIFYAIRWCLWKIIYDTYGYNGQRDVWPMHATIAWLLLIVMVLSLGVALFAWLTPHRELVPIAVIGVWGAIVMGSATAIALTPKGRQELFERSVGGEKFLMPNRYRPPNEESGGGFAFIACLDPFDEEDRTLWRESAYVSVRTLDEGLAYFSSAGRPANSIYVSDIDTWKDNRSEMKPLGPLFGHDQFEFTRESFNGPNVITEFYLLRYDGERLARLVRCSGKSPESRCSQYVFSETRLLYINSKMWAVEHWEDVEENLEGLFARWRVTSIP